jgi:hypothetical protein
MKSPSDSSVAVELEEPRPVDREPRLRGSAIAHALALLADKPKALRLRPPARRARREPLE